MTTHPTTLGADSTSGPVPVDFHGTLVIGPRWALTVSAVGRLLAPLARLLDRLIPAAVWLGLLVVPVVVTGHAAIVGLSDTWVGYRPVHLVVAGIGVLLIGWITADVIGFGRANRAAARTRTVDYIDGWTLPDDPDLAEPTGVGAWETA